MRTAILFVLFASGCSFVFDPSKVPTPSSCTSAAAPESLIVESGSSVGRLVWSWQTSSGGAYQLCTLVPGGAAECQRVDCATAGDCSFTQDALTPGVRVTGTLSAVDSCDGGAVGSITAAASAIDPSSMSGWVLERKDCTIANASVLSGVISIDQSGGACITSFTTGDDGWNDLTLDAEIRISSVANGVAGGFVLAQNGAGDRLRFISNVDRASDLFPSEVRLRENSTELIVANGVHAIDTDWVHVRLVKRGATISWQQGPVGGALLEVLRWNDRVSRPGRFGITGQGTGRFEVRNLRISTSLASIPTEPTSLTRRFGEDGGMTGARSIGVSPARGPCPQLADCAAGCAPPSGANCALLARTGFFIDYTQLAAPPPHALDPSKDWHVAVRFGFPPDAGNAGNVIMEVPLTRLLDASRTETTLARSNVVPAMPLAAGTWHFVTLTLPADGGFITGVVDGVNATSNTVWPPGDAFRNLEALHFGNALNSSDLYLHEVTVSQ